MSMRKHLMPEMKEGGVNVTPLIDVVMCLIIFFMLVAKIGVSTGAAPMALPTTIFGKKIEALGDTVFVNVTDPALERDKKTGIPLRDDNGKLVYIPSARNLDPIVQASFNENKLDAQQTIELRTPNGGHPFREQLLTAVNARKKVGKEKEFSVTIRAEKDMAFGKLQLVLAEIAQAGVRNVNYGAKQPPGG
jgi:biopolymer transport protein ExbD